MFSVFSKAPYAREHTTHATKEEALAALRAGADSLAADGASVTWQKEENVEGSLGSIGDVFFFSGGDGRMVTCYAAAAWGIHPPEIS